MTTSRIEVNLDGSHRMMVYRDHLSVECSIDGMGVALSLGRARNVLVSALHAVDTMLEQHSYKTTPEHPSSGVGAGATSHRPEGGRTVEPTVSSAGGGCSDKCSGGCRLPSSPISCGRCEPDPEADSCECGCQYTNLECCCAR